MTVLSPGRSSVLGRPYPGRAVPPRRAGLRTPAARKQVNYSLSRLEVGLAVRSSERPEVVETSPLSEPSVAEVANLVPDGATFVTRRGAWVARPPARARRCSRRRPARLHIRRPVCRRLAQRAGFRGMVGWSEVASDGARLRRRGAGRRAPRAAGRGRSRNRGRLPPESGHRGGAAARAQRAAHRRRRRGVRLLPPPASGRELRSARRNEPEPVPEGKRRAGTCPYCARTWKSRRPQNARIAGFHGRGADAP
jgi:hypothetical protein